MMLVAGAAGATPALAQRVTDTRAGAQAPRDTGATGFLQDTVPPLSPRRAFLYSLLVPGSAQLRLQRPTAGALFVLVEAAGVAMMLKSGRDLAAVRRLRADSVVGGYEYRGVRADGSDSVVAVFVPGPVTEALVDARRTHHEDWIALIVFNHFFAGAEAFVAAHLWDLPTDIIIAPAPEGRGAALRARIRFDE
ncbi:MAG TPA: hypothetical protein VNA89_04410 [Gemmatimonadaceae bacterium]|nr:hypothetical protein [Gemmatimonadaceae bacterium]